MLLVLEFLGVAAFAVSGALAAVRARLDLFGVVVLGMVTALGGGVIRDLMLDVHPPTTLQDWRYLLVSGAAGLLAFQFHPQLARLRRAVLLADAVGLGLFVTSGTATALALGAPVYTSCLIGLITGIGGGILRDLLLREVPLVLRREIYAVAALVGTVVVGAGEMLGLPAGPVVLIGSTLVVGLRVLALWRRWNAPLPKDPTH
ncbi:trimeric intracellular cation channel family protein [Actinoalloteichus sp. GBA129-24]|uniref:trimeric intracellular cation channel family protein n=1 Tax=Actinoalloteichus sp. GBA129-24 TaxID=1612551 RepID=UPI00095046BD|nr:trimeric intracellular cation channel family protein [Actinoalloteichus sp. GBA129-24]APU18695.1 putative membrane protein [Actinoalloteichus sp. GBA129-24]